MIINPRKNRKNVKKFNFFSINKLLSIKTICLLQQQIGFHKKKKKSRYKTVCVMKTTTLCNSRAKNQSLCEIMNIYCVIILLQILNSMLFDRSTDKKNIIQDYRLSFYLFGLRVYRVYKCCALTFKD